MLVSTAPTPSSQWNQDSRQGMPQPRRRGAPCGRTGMCPCPAHPAAVPASLSHQPDSSSGVKSFYKLLDFCGNQLVGAQHPNKVFSPHQVDWVVIELAWQGASIYNFVYNLVCREYFVWLQRSLIFSVAEGNDDFCPTQRGLQGLKIK